MAGGGGSTVFVPLSEFLLSDGSQTINLTPQKVLIVLTKGLIYNQFQRYDYTGSQTFSTTAGKLYYLIEDIYGLSSEVNIIGKDLPFFSFTIDAHAVSTPGYYASASVTLHKNIFSIDF